MSKTHRKPQGIQTTTPALPQEENEAEKLILTQEEVWNVVQFARAYSGIYGGGVLTPDLVSGRMKDISLNPMAATEASLADALQNPKDNETNLQKFSQNFELQSMVYKRLLAYLSNMLSFDFTYTSNAEEKEYTTARYQKDLGIVEDFMEKFEYEKELRIVVREMLRNDAYFGCFIDTGNKYVLQELPSEYCKITGRWEGGFLFSFNMYWFIQPGVDLRMYPSFFKRKYMELFGTSNTTQRYIPSLSPELRSKSSWVYWVDVPVNLGVCFKLTPELATRLPYFTPLFNDLVLQGLMRNLQKNMNMAAASKIIMGEVPLLNKDIKATVKDSIAISPDLLGKFLALVKSAISDSIKVASAPLQEIEGISFDTDNAMYDSYLRTALASSGINTNLIFSSNVKPNAIETQLSLNVDEQMMTALYEQFEDFINYYINKRTKSFKFNISFEGTNFFLDREQRLDKAMKMFEKGIIMPQKIAAALGMKPSEMRKQMQEAKANGFMDMLTVPSFEQQKEILAITQKNQKEITKINIESQKDIAETNAENQQKIAKANKAAMPTTAKTPATKTAEDAESKGRPKKKLSELGEEGMQTRSQGSNIGRGGKVR